ncbi:hypothetical protein RAH41_02405 [Gottfriedia acidiceleris]|uniref:hypothetical protein n=1 Tax=Gottfriedia acidiceleris TaxID=371036 RepID=UPI002F26B601
MDLSFDKLLEQFDLKKNEHQKNLHKVNKRIDEIESHMEEIKKQLHNFDHQIIKIEKEIKTTLSMISSENESSSHHDLDHNKKHHEHHEQKEQNRHQKHHEGHERHPDHHNWAENLIHNVEEFSASIFEPKHESHHEQKKHHEVEHHQKQDHQEHHEVEHHQKQDHQEHHEVEHHQKQDHQDHHEVEHHQKQDHQEHEHFEEKQHNSRVANRKKYNNNIENLNQYSASTLDESQSSGIITGLTSFNEKNYSELSSDFINHNENYNENHHQHNDYGKVTNEKKTSEQLLETDFSDLSIDDWEDSTTNLSMSEWFEVDPNDKR